MWWRYVSFMVLSMAHLLPGMTEHATLIVLNFRRLADPGGNHSTLVMKIAGILLPTIAVKQVCHQMKYVNIQIEVVQFHSFLQSQDQPYMVHM